MPKLTKIDTHKKALLEALEKSLGVVTTACKSVGVSRASFYNWYNEDPEFREAADSMQDVALDFAESQLFQQIKGGVPSSTIFYLKTKGKKRGYIEEKHYKGVVSVEDRKTLAQADPSLLDALIQSISEDDD